ncbi:hypothetical protein H311_00832 [Anncaliia algerae PRA109]|nr:hypothetical protein H311_02863 [Anncaliia algerae PRA109]KCZ78144.1 hypothetical protein H311_00832 [Anncaliia algerae PRA109]
MFKDIDSNMNPKKTKSIDNYENSIEFCRALHLKEKDKFLSRKHMLHPLQVTFDQILLEFEEEVFFKRSLKLHFTQPENRYPIDFNQFNTYKKESPHEYYHKKPLKEMAKLYKCEEPECDKVYTSLHGLKYHLDKGHLSNDYDKKPFVCAKTGCKKRYKNSNGLKYHLEHGHKCK